MGGLMPSIGPRLLSLRQITEILTVIKVRLNKHISGAGLGWGGALWPPLPSFFV